MTNPLAIVQSPTWLAQSSEDVEDVDEPPELRSQQQSADFQRTMVRKPNEQSSLLTRAIMGHFDDEAQHDAFNDDRRRRSMASNVSVASTADLTSDTGLTSPARTNTPSPPPPEVSMLRIPEGAPPKRRSVSFLGAPFNPQVEEAKVQDAPRKRSIQFACAAKPTTQERPVPMIKTPSAQEVTRRPCIKFACPNRPSSTQNTPPRLEVQVTPRQSTRTQSPSTKLPTAAANGPPSPRFASRKSPSRSLPRPKFLRASSVDLTKDGSQFHEFARETAREDDWIRQESCEVRSKLTINDTLTKENHIRRLGAEAEEEAELEEEENEAALDDEDDLDVFDDEEEDDEEDEEEEDEDEEDEDEDGYEGADGYATDEETGFADSDSDSEEDENMIFWTPVQRRSTIRTTEFPKIRRPSLHEQLSDSSVATTNGRPRQRKEKVPRLQVESDALDLPDSTDFVCGTLDEDRPLEEAYLTCLAARRNEKLRVIPQDIDPSFPASDPEDEDEEEIYNPVHHSSDDEETWMQGEMEDLHHDQTRSRKKKRTEGASPRRLRSPPPTKRFHSPAPKARGRSPRPLFDRHSPRRMKSPAPKTMTTPVGSPRLGANVKFQLAGRPGLMHTKSLPRPAAFFQMKQGRCAKTVTDSSDAHIRGAVDIVKGLEKKRQRRREKFHQKYCDRARRGQIPERKTMPGRGAERMKELGLLMAGKKDQGNYVLSI